MKGILGKVYVETFGVFSIQIVHSYKQLNEFMIMVDKVVFQKIEIVPYSKINEDITILVVELESSFHMVQHLACVNWEFCQVEEVEQSMDHPDNSTSCSTT